MIGWQALLRPMDVVLDTTPVSWDHQPIHLPEKLILGKNSCLVCKWAAWCASCVHLNACTYVSLPLCSLHCFLYRTKRSIATWKLASVIFRIFPPQRVCVGWNILFICVRIRGLKNCCLLWTKFLFFLDVAVSLFYLHFSSVTNIRTGDLGFCTFPISGIIWAERCLTEITDKLKWGW